MTAYCGTCRSYFEVSGNPPYGVIHTVTNPPEHLHAITRQKLKQKPSEFKLDPTIDPIW